MERGDVYLAEIALPDRDRPTEAATTGRRKFVVALQGGPAFDNAQDFAFVVASSLRGPGSRSFEVLVGPTEGFDHETVIDCRWVYTAPKDLLPQSRRFRLPAQVMDRVDEALVIGLQLGQR